MRRQLKPLLVVAVMTSLALSGCSEARGIGRSAWTIRLHGLSPDVRALRVEGTENDWTTIEVQQTTPGQVVEFACLLPTGVSSSVWGRKTYPYTNRLTVTLIKADESVEPQFYRLSVTKFDGGVIDATLVPD